MPLNEDALRKVFVDLLKKMAPAVEENVVFHEGLEFFEPFEADIAFKSFKAAYSPEVLQALGVKLVEVTPHSFEPVLWELACREMIRGGVES